MSDEKKKLTPEELEKLKQIQQFMMMQKTGGIGMPGMGQAGMGNPGMHLDAPKLSLIERVKHISVKNILKSILHAMQGWVKFIDQFIDLVTKKDGGSADDVVKSARAPIIFGVFVTLFFFVFGFLWSATAPLDSAAVAIGTVVSSSQKKVLNHQEGGIIKKIYVKIGDRVREGDKLLELDDTRTKSDYESVLHQYRIALASEARLNAELNKEEKITWPQILLDSHDDPDVAKILQSQGNLFTSRRNLEMAEKESLKQKAKQLEKQIEGLMAKKVALKKSLEATRDRLRATKELNVKGFAQKSVLLEMETREANISSEIAVTETEIARSEQEITRNEIELLNIDSKVSAQALNELRQAQGELANSKERYVFLKEALGRMVLRAPVSGVVNQLNFHTVGSNIPQSAPIVEISPENDLLVIDAKVDPKNIDAIKVGLISKIRFSAFKSRTTPVFNGTVVSLSPDIVVDQQGRAPGDPLAGGYYLARIELNMDEFKEVARTRKLELHPGMQAEVQIVTGTRTLLKYLLDPVYDAMFKGFKEK